MKTYELINMSDLITLQSKNEKSAQIAALWVGSGCYGLHTEEDRQSLPILMFGGFNEWFSETFPEFNDLGEAIDYYKADLIKTLGSFYVMDFKDRKFHYKKCKDLFNGSHKKTIKYMRNISDENRSSLNDICSRAWILSKILEGKN